jgi:cobalt-precorrin-5B (C1)-methyltransferase
MQTHAAGSEVNMELLAGLAAELGGSEAVVAEIRAANTARHVLELCQREGLTGVTSLVCRRVSENCRNHAGGALDVHARLVDFNGTLLGSWPA